MRLDDIDDLQQDILLDLVEIDPFHGVGKGVDKEIQRGRREFVKIHDQGLPAVDLLMVLQHLPDRNDDRPHFGRVRIADADGLLDAAVAHAGRVFHRDGGKHRIRHIQRPLVKGADRGQPPADLLDRALDLLIRRTDPVADIKGPIHIDHKAAKEIGQQIARRKADRDAAYAAKRQHPGDTVTQGLHADQRRRDDHRDAQQLGDGVQRGLIIVGPGGLFFADDIGLRALDKTHQKPGQHKDNPDIAQRPDRPEDGRLGLALDNIGGKGQPQDPDKK